MHGDGDGWVTCALGHRHWGRHGAAGLLITDASTAASTDTDTDATRIVLQHRATGTHEGDTWGLPGGARDSHEDAVDTALREAGEEAGIDPATVAPIGRSTVDHGGWSYTTVVARAIAPVHPHAANWESNDVRWCTVEEVDRLPLHPGFAHSWPALQSFPGPVTIVVDVANVVGSRPDGWWRDRPGASSALRARIVQLARRGVGAATLPAGVDAGALSTLFPRWVLVVEGQSSALAPGGSTTWWDRQLHTVAAPGSGDDEIVARAGTGPARGQSVVVTADRGLRARVAPAVAVGPQWLLDQLDPR